MNIAINGFGRIGRTFLRAVLDDAQAKEKLKISAINLGPAQPEGLDLLFKYDTTMGSFPGTVNLEPGCLVIDGQKIKLIQEADPARLPWADLGIDWVVECTGKFASSEKAELHRQAGAKKVLISAPADKQTKTIVLGVNSQDYDPATDNIVSLGSCTTNCLAPVVKVIMDNGGMESAAMTTVHAYTPDQNLLDNSHADPRRARAAAQNIIPAKTGVDKVISWVFPELEGRIKAFSIRVPVAKVSIIDLTFFTSYEQPADFWNEKLIQAAQGPMKGILECSPQPLVSSDFAGNKHSSIVDLAMTKSLGKTHKIFAWYDNEAGYSNRLKDFLMMAA